MNLADGTVSAWTCDFLCGLLCTCSPQPDCSESHLPSFAKCVILTLPESPTQEGLQNLWGLSTEICFPWVSGMYSSLLVTWPQAAHSEQRKSFFPFPLSHPAPPLLPALVCTAAFFSSYVTWWAQWIQVLHSPCQHSCWSTVELFQFQTNIGRLLCLLFYNRPQIYSWRLSPSFVTTAYCLVWQSCLPTTPGNLHAC